MGVDAELVLEVEDLFPEEEAGVGGAWVAGKLGLSGDGARDLGMEFGGRKEGNLR